MARLMNRLSHLKVSRATKPGYYGDGLWVRVSPSGSQSWVFRFFIAKKQREMGLGAAHTVSLAEARAKARECRQDLLEGRDSLEVRRATQMAEALQRARMMTFGQCAAAYILAYRAGWKSAKHADQWTNAIRTYASPVFGHLPVAEVDTGLIVKCLAPVWESKTETASRARAHRVRAGLGHHQRLPHRRESCPLERPPRKLAGHHQQVEPDAEPSVTTVAANRRVHVCLASA